MECDCWICINLKIQYFWLGKLGSGKGIGNYTHMDTTCISVVCYFITIAKWYPLIDKFKICFQNSTWRWNLQNSRPPVEYVALEVQVYFPHNSLRCSWLWVGITYVYFIPRIGQSLLGGLSTNSVFYSCQNYRLTGINIIFKKIM